MNNLPEARPVPVQFSLGTLLLFTANIALLAVIGQFPDYTFYGMGKLLKAHSVLASIYIWRFMSIRSGSSNRVKWTVLLTVFVAFLPFIYFCIGSMFNGRFGYPPSKWLGAPIWIFTVPIISFWMFDLNKKRCSLKSYLIRSSIEIILLFHAWTFVWILIQFSLGWAWI